MRHKLTHAGEDGESHGEAALAEAQSVQCACAQYVTFWNSIGAQTRNGFGDEECIAFLHALAQVAQELVDAAAHITFQGRWADPDLTVANLQRKYCNVVPAFGKASPGGQIEAPMVPVATQHAILDRSLRKGIAHMRTTAIERSDLS